MKVVVMIQMMMKGTVFVGCRHDLAQRFTFVEEDGFLLTPIIGVIHPITVFEVVHVLTASFEGAAFKPAPVGSLLKCFISLCI